MTTVESNTFTGPNAGVAGGYVPLTTIESTAMDSDLNLVKDDLDYHLSTLQSIYAKLDTIESGATVAPTAEDIVNTINGSALKIDADNLEATVALLSNIVSNIESHRTTTSQAAMHPEDSIKSTGQTYSYTPSSIVTSCQNVLDEINNLRYQIDAIVGKTTWIDAPDTTITIIKSKLDTIESGATADQSDTEIRALVDSALDSNVLTDALNSKLNNIEANANLGLDNPATEDLDMDSNAIIGIDSMTLPDDINGDVIISNDNGDAKIQITSGHYLKIVVV